MPTRARPAPRHTARRRSSAWSYPAWPPTPQPRAVRSRTVRSRVMHPRPGCRTPSLRSVRPCCRAGDGRRRNRLRGSRPAGAERCRRRCSPGRAVGGEMLEVHGVSGPGFRGGHGWLGRNLTLNDTGPRWRRPRCAVHATSCTAHAVGIRSACDRWRHDGDSPPKGDAHDSLAPHKHHRRRGRARAARRRTAHRRTHRAGCSRSSSVSSSGAFGRPVRAIPQY